jgi:outer membrane protein assembly factor BamB
VSRRTFVLIAPAFAVVLAVAAAVWIYDGDRGPAPPGHSATGLVRAWSAGAASLDTGPAGVWVTGRDVVVNAGNGVVADNLATGRSDWRWQPPAGMYFDDMSPAADLGIAVVAYGTGASASANPDAGATSAASPGPTPSAESGIGAGPAAAETVAALDLATGRVLWSTPLAYPIGWPGPVIGDGKVAVLEQAASGGFGALDVLDLSTGEPAWSTASDPAIPAGCAFTSAAISGGLVYAAAQCSQPGAADPTTGPGTEILYGFAPETGAIRTNTSTTGFICADPDQSTYATLWAAAGYLLVSCSENTTLSQPLWIRATGAQKLLAAHFASQTDPLSYEFQNLQYPAFAAAGSTLYIQILIPGAGGGGGRPAVIALDLRTGRQLWQQLIPGGAGYLVGADSTGSTVALESGGTLSLARLARSTGTIAYGPGTAFTAAAGVRGTYRVLAAGTALIAVLPGDPEAAVTEFRRASAG